MQDVAVFLSSKSGFGHLQYPVVLILLLIPLEDAINPSVLIQ
jgi:hypothetical protein